MSPNIVDSGTCFGGPRPLIARFTFGTDSGTSIKPVEVVFSGEIDVLVFETVLNGFFHFYTDAILIGLETLTTKHTRPISVGGNALVWVRCALVFGIQVIVRFTLSADFLTA